jgi:O-succinylbenzoic acid--CoA ligase
MTTYPFDSIFINGRDVLIRHIIGNEATPQSEFEHGTFSFIRDWHKGVDSFSQLTSGSTGEAKKITLSRGQMIRSAELTQKALHLQEGWHCLLCLQPSFIAGKMMMVRSFVTGMKIIATEPLANPFLKLSSVLPIDFVALVPYQLHKIVRSESANLLNTVKSIIVGGAIVDSETREKLQEFSCQFYATYGMTETISHVALMALNGKFASDCYNILPGITISIDERDCLIIQGDHLPGREIITNDLVELTDRNKFRWLGRWDNVINTGGLKVIPEKLEAEIEKIFQKLGIAGNFLISSLPDLKLGNRIVLLLEQKVSEPLLEILMQEMRERIPKHEVPKEVFSGISFQLANNGKINRTATQRLVAETRNSSK